MQFVLRPLLSKSRLCSLSFGLGGYGYHEIHGLIFDGCYGKRWLCKSTLLARVLSVIHKTSKHSVNQVWKSPLF